MLRELQREGEPAYPDSPTGARKLLEKEADNLDHHGATFQPDPEIPGCWLIELQDGTRILAYLGSHPLAPDFEIVERD